MKFTKVTYSKLFPLQQFSNERIEVEIQIDDHESEMAALELAKKTVLRFHEQSVKQDEERQVVKIEKTSVNGSAIDEIVSCKTIKELKEWEVYVNGKGKQGLKKIYEEHLQKLQNGN